MTTRTRPTAQPETSTPPTTPRSPSARISRSTVQRATSMPSRLS